MTSLLLRPWLTETGIWAFVGNACSIYPLFESGDGNCKNCTPVTNSMINFSQHIYTQTSCSVYMIPFPFRWCGQFPAKWMLSRVLWMLKSGGGICGQQSSGSSSLQVSNAWASERYRYCTMDPTKLQKLHCPEHRAFEGLFHHWRPYNGNLASLLDALRSWQSLLEGANTTP